MKAAGLILVILGILALVYQGITYTHDKQVLKVGPISAHEQETQTVPIPPILGVVAILGGGAMFIYGSKNA